MLPICQLPYVIIAVTQLKNRFRVLAALLIATFSFISVPVAVADPPAAARITGVEQVTDRWIKLSVYSPSMDRVIVNDVYRAPGNASAPTLHLLNGIDGGLDNKGWFFANKNVNVVSPIGGQYSYYTDWIVDDPAIGRNKWQTYLPADFPTPVGGQLVEQICLECSQQFADAAKAAGVPITFVVRPEGVHTWGLFES
jgi:diacylglycerol O-acyltransferase/trehalose O-mycolyltransferase